MQESGFPINVLWFGPELLNKFGNIPPFSEALFEAGNTQALCRIFSFCGVLTQATHAKENLEITR